MIIILFTLIVLGFTYSSNKSVKAENFETISIQLLPKMFSTKYYTGYDSYTITIVTTISRSTVYLYTGSKYDRLYAYTGSSFYKATSYRYGLFLPTTEYVLNYKETLVSYPVRYSKSTFKIVKITGGHTYITETFIESSSGPTSQIYITYISTIIYFGFFAVTHSTTTMYTDFEATVIFYIQSVTSMTSTAHSTTLDIVQSTRIVHSTRYSAVYYKYGYATMLTVTFRTKPVFSTRETISDSTRIEILDPSAGTIQIIGTTTVGENTIMHVTLINLKTSRYSIDTSAIGSFIAYGNNIEVTITRLEPITKNMKYPNGSLITTTGTTSYYLTSTTVEITYKYGIYNKTLYVDGYTENAVILFTGVYINTPRTYSTISDGITLLFITHDNTTTAKIIFESTTILSITSNLPAITVQKSIITTVNTLKLTIKTTANLNSVPHSAFSNTDGYYVYTTALEVLLTLEHFTTNGTDYETAELRVPLEITYSYSIIALSTKTTKFGNTIMATAPESVEKTIGKVLGSIYYIILAALMLFIIYTAIIGIVSGNIQYYKRRIMLALTGTIIIYLLPRILDWIANL